jgi:lactate dehydrogenase-like 2-hydroxyacid dehydrogenase
MSTPKVLQIGPVSARLDAGMAEQYGAHPLWKEADSEALLAQNGPAFEVAVTSARYGFTAGLMDCLPSLKAICSHGVGYDSIDVEAARVRGILVSNTPGVLNDCVADLTIGLMIAAARRMAEGERLVRLGQWPADELGLGTQVSHKRLGIVGLGRIGKAVARRAIGFGMEVRYHNRKSADGATFAYEPTLEGLASWADFLVLTCAGGPATRNLISEAELKALGPKGILINVSRGSVVDEPALIAALQNGTIGGAGLDVYASEPSVPNALMELPNTVLMPHIGSATVETRRAMEDLVFRNVAEFLRKGRLVTPV